MRVDAHNCEAYERPTDMPSRKGPVCASVVGASLFCFGLVAFPAVAFAYRPFDGTDAAVADPGQIEMEFQPMGFEQEGSRNALIGPANVFNYGFAPRWEAVLQGQLESQIAPSSRESLTSNEAFLKYIARPGVLQDQSGPSIATEFGAILPNVGVPGAIKPSWNWIISQRFDWGTLHLNFALNEMSDPRTDLFLDMIIEGPANWTVRPVAEVFSDSMLGGPQTLSGLVGLIWQVREDLALDIAVRHATTAGHEVNELRAGVTFAFPVDQGHAEPASAAKALHPTR
jgi:hypothetical protein